MAPGGARSWVFRTGSLSSSPPVLHGSEEAVQRGGQEHGDEQACDNRHQLNMYIDLPERSPKSKNKGDMGSWTKAMCGKRGAPRVWPEEVHREIRRRVTVRASCARRCTQGGGQRFAVVRADDFLCVRPPEALDALRAFLHNIYVLKRTISRFKLKRSIWNRPRNIWRIRRGRK